MPIRTIHKPRALSRGVIAVLVLGISVAIGPNNASGARASNVMVTAGVSPEGMGGGPAPLPTDEITEEQRAEIRESLRASVERLRAEGKLIEPSSRTLAVSFAWPMRIAPGLDDPGHHGISNFVDHNPSFPNALLDYNCGTRSYDQANGYNHAGTDIFTWPWGFRKMDLNQVQVIAAAPGQIIFRADGNYDRNCGFGNGSWNAVYVQHADGSIAWYGHMKSGSLTPKQAGDTVAQGEYLGIVGSSGNSTGPHLHFEVYDAQNQLFDPWLGACNAIGTSGWSAQRPYYDSAINRVTTGATTPTFPNCPTQESPNASVTFAQGSQIYFTTYYRDQLQGQNSTYTIYRPNGTIYSQWSAASSDPHYALSWWYWWFTINDQQGTWRFTVSYQSRTVERFFTIGSPQASGRVPESSVQGPTLQAQKLGGQVRLIWGSSCVASDNDYVVYEGVVGNFTSHLPVVCTTGGLADLTFTPGAGNRYFLIGPRNAAREGSLGTASNGSARPPSSAACLTRLALACP